MKSRKQPSLVSGQCKTPLGVVIIADIFLIGAGLIIFALFHHVIPRDFIPQGQSLPGITSSTTSVTTSATTGFTQDTGQKETSTGTSGSENPVDTSAETENDGSWASKFPGMFTDGEIYKSDSTYQSSNINIRIKKVSDSQVTYYIADIHLRDIIFFRTAFAGGQYARGVTDEVLDMAEENDAILALTGDYYGIRDSGVVIRNGQLYREVPFEDVLVMNVDGSMETFSKNEFDIDKVKTEGAWQAWSFGPMLLDDGQPMTTFNSSVNPRNPRSAIGYYEPGHYCFVLVDGRQPDYSIGMTLKQLSTLFYDLGCAVAYNLDGGESAVMTFLGKWTNQPYKDGRRISDIVYIGEVQRNDE